MTDFTQLGLAAPLVDAVTAEGYTQPTPIQAQAIPHLLAGRDLLGLAATGTGKTAAFALPILQMLNSGKKSTPNGACRALVLSPTRELAAQIADSFKSYGRNLGLRVALVVGGVGQRPQAAALARGPDIVVATPGRLLDHIDQRNLRLDAVEILVLDEADHMLDLGFLPSVRRIVRQIPAARQSLFFSATMPPEIGKLAGDLLRDPVRVAVTPSATPAERIEQEAIFVDQAAKTRLLADRIADSGGARTLVFTRTKRGADRVVKSLAAAGIAATAIHGNKSQPQRDKALAGFRTGSTPVLIATDIAARGIDVDDVALVVNFDLPHVPETYVHRIGRTARAGASGRALALVSGEERPLLKAIEKLLGRGIPVKAGGAGSRQMPEAATSADRQRQSSRPSSNRPASNQRHGSDNRPPRRPVAAEAHGGDIAGVGFMQPSGQRPPVDPRHRRGRAFNRALARA
ncbi:MAG TPA: DEAD/DEAH box helicase [Afifellaceae bacterium]|nr:DEAD/DEAH box helicase [Afifellaceae bacterium]